MWYILLVAKRKNSTTGLHSVHGLAPTNERVPMSQVLRERIRIAAEHQGISTDEWIRRVCDQAALEQGVPRGTQHQPGGPVPDVIALTPDQQRYGLDSRDGRSGTELPAMAGFPIRADGWAVPLRLVAQTGRQACGLCGHPLLGDTYQVFGDTICCADCRRMVGDMANHEFAAHLVALANALLERQDGRWVAKPVMALLPF